MYTAWWMTLGAGLCLGPLPAMGQLPGGNAGIAVERRLATAARLHVGDTVVLSSTAHPAGVPARVSAIYEPRPDPSTIMRRDFHVRLHLPELTALTGSDDRVDRVGVALRPGISPEGAAARLNRTAFGYRLSPSKTIAAQSSTTFIVVSRFHRAIAFISVLASTIFLLCLMLLKVEERRTDVAVLRFAGISRRTVFVSLVLESAALAVAGSILGAVIGSIASTVVNAYYQHAFDSSLLFSELTVGTLCFALGLSVALGVVAGSVAAWRMVRIPPVELWNRAA